MLKIILIIYGATNHQKEDSLHFKFIHQFKLFFHFQYSKKQDKTIKNIVKKGFIIHRKTPSVSLVPSYDIDKLKQNDISLKTNFPESYKQLQKDDYLKVCRYQTTEALAQTCLALAKEQPEKIDKLLPNLSKFIAENCP